jgi:hypothetical protein
MKHRFTIKELETMSDQEILLILVQERMSGTTNVYSPLNQRLGQIRNKLERSM